MQILKLCAAPGLDQVFVAEIDAKIARFTTLCADTHTAVSGAYETLLTAIDSVDPTALVSPGGVPSASTALASAGDQPSYVAAVGSPQVANDPGNEATPPTGQNPVRAPSITTVAAQETPSSLALAATPSVTEISETTDLGLGSNTGTEDAPGTDDSSATEDGSELGVDDSSLDLGDSALGMNDSTTTPPMTTSAPGAWTPADITAMMTAVGTITGNIPDMITAFSDLAGNLDEIIKATGEATAAVIDATDNQPSTSGPALDDTEATDDPSSTSEKDSSGTEAGLGSGGDGMTLEEYLNSEDSSSTGLEDTTQESAGTESAVVGMNASEQMNTPPLPAPTTAAPTSYGSLSGIVVTTAPRPSSTNNHLQQTLITTQNAKTTL